MQVFKVNVINEVLEEIEIEIEIEIEEKIYSLDQSPTRCPYADEMVFHDYEIRNLIFGEYRILFHIDSLEVQVLHVKHGKMQRIPIAQPSKQ